MGVTVLQPYPVDNKSGAQTIEFLVKRVLALGAVQVGHFLVDCETYTSIPPTKTVHILHNSEQPASVFSILDTGTKQIPLVTDGLFDLLMARISPVYTSKKQTKIESKGPRFEFGDFLIKLGIVTMSQNFKGVLVEVEYRPCLIAASCWELMREFLQGFLGSNVSNSIPAYFTQRINMNTNHTKANDIYQPIDTINQYLEHFTNYRKQTSAVTSRP
ncbi:mediator of RNA polymerase II transcription subunit 20 [Topomyia yanbarensis]|uniref:mediator of RNA polymerase II transcription subunit 20 n=1 Tax=Topomyia yanbarensis TaxID=2498891 RepID=UPI00273C2551|nr:mediator of RNA polymerase II transcription subunit 20 [Topomyia yanbarensis]